MNKKTYQSPSVRVKTVDGSELLLSLSVYGDTDTDTVDARGTTMGSEDDGDELHLSLRSVWDD